MQCVFVIDPKISLKLSFRQVVSGNPVPGEKALDSRSTDCGNDGQGLFSCSLVSQRLMSIPAKAGNYKEMDSRFHGNPWIPHQVRNDNFITHCSVFDTSQLCCGVVHYGYTIK
jgi:hypothetical protein